MWQWDVECLLICLLYRNCLRYGGKNQHEQFLKQSCFKVSHSCLATLKKKKKAADWYSLLCLRTGKDLALFGLQYWIEILPSLIASSNCLRMSVTIHRCCWQCLLQKDMKEIEKPLFWDLKPYICTQTRKSVKIYLNFKKNILIAL